MQNNLEDEKVNKLTNREIYEGLYDWYYKTFKLHCYDMYEGHNHIERLSNKFAIKNTLIEWKRQYKDSK